MPDHLFAFMGDRLIGRFDRTGDEEASFTYDDSYAGPPLSLSLPVGDEADGGVAYNYLDNLLPENEEARERLAIASGTTADTFDLISRLGEDVAGAVSLSPDEDLPSREAAALIEATADDIAYRIATLRRDPASPPPAHIRPRWSLAGQQAKFSLSRVGEKWFWSTYEHPSTHIFKPAAAQYPGADLAEKACLDLARECAIPSSRSDVMEFRGQRAYAVQRWDRASGLRLRAEDMLQAMGLPPYEKYSVGAPDVVGVLRHYGQEWQFVRQLAFNVAVGNSDAHAKNYSVLLSRTGARLAPLYDTLPIFLWPKVDQRNAMDIGGAFRRSDTSEESWVEFARQARLDPGRVLDEVRAINGHVAQRLPDALHEAGLPVAAVDAAALHVHQLRTAMGMTRYRLSKEDGTGK